MLKYSINFLFVLSAYASGRVDESYKRRIWEKFRNNIIEELKRNYHFYLLQSNYDRTEAIDKHFRLLNGKIFNSFKDDRILLFAYEKGMLGLPQLFDEIKDDFRIIPYQLGEDVDEALRNRISIDYGLGQKEITRYSRREIKESGKLVADSLVHKD